MRSRALATLDAAMLVLALALIAPTDNTLGGLGLALFGLLSLLLLVLTETCIPHERGRFVVFAEIASVPIVVGAGALVTLIALRAGGTHLGVDDAVVPWLLASAYVVAGRTAFAWAAATLPVASVTEVLDLVTTRILDLVVAVALLVLGYLAIYLLVFLPRGTVG